MVSPFGFNAFSNNGFSLQGTAGNQFSGNTQVINNAGLFAPVANRAPQSYLPAASLGLGGNNGFMSMLQTVMQMMTMMMQAFLGRGIQQPAAAQPQTPVYTQPAVPPAQTPAYPPAPAPTPVSTQPDETPAPAAPAPSYPEAQPPVYDTPQPQPQPQPTYPQPDQPAPPTPEYPTPEQPPAPPPAPPEYPPAQPPEKPEKPEKPHKPKKHYQMTHKGTGTGRHYSDPHFVGEDGEKYDAFGKDGHVYNILSDKNIQYNGKFSNNWGPHSSVMSEAGLKVGKDKIRLTTGNKPGTPPTINGKAMKRGKKYKLDNGSTATWDGDNLTVRTDEYQIKLRPFVSTYSKNGKTDFINGDYKLLKNPNADKVAPHGIWGQTIDADDKKRAANKVLDFKNSNGTITRGSGTDAKVMAQYEVSNLFGNDFEFNRFGAPEGTGLQEV